MEFAKNYIDKPISLWEKTIFVDENKYNVFGSDGKEKVWRKPGRALNKENLEPRIKGSAGSVMSRSGSTVPFLVPNDVDNDDDDDSTPITQSTLPKHHCRMSHITRHADSPKSLQTETEHVYVGSIDARRSCNVSDYKTRESTR
ncbi:hypothetical protein ANTPLA_LOCUS5046 [Anthophora plagiata]